MDRRINYGFTGVGWFLSTFMFLMLITIPLVAFTRRIIKNKKRKQLSLFVLMIITIVLGFLYTYILKIFDIDYTQFMYIFPLSRIFEYYIALLLGMFISKIDKIKINKFIVTIIEILLIILLVFLLKYMTNYPMLNKSIGWIIPNILLLIVFSYEKGYISKLLSNRIVVSLGGLAFELYILHQVVNMYFYVVPRVNDNLTIFKRSKNLFFILIITIMLAYLVDSFNVLEKFPKLKKLTKK